MSHYTIQYNTIQSNLFQLSHMSIIIIIHCIFLNEKSKRICRKLNKLIRDIPRIGMGSLNGFSAGEHHFRLVSRDAHTIVFALPV